MFLLYASISIYGFIAYKVSFAASTFERPTYYGVKNNLENYVNKNLFNPSNISKMFNLYIFEKKNLFILANSTLS